MQSYLEIVYYVATTKIFINLTISQLLQVPKKVLQKVFAVVAHGYKEITKSTQ